MVSVTMLSLSEDAEKQIEHMLAAYNALKGVFWGSEYLVSAATALARLAEPQQYENIAARSRVIYGHMKSSHPFLTNMEDSSFAALLALSVNDDLYITQETERCYNILKSKFFSRNAVQALSQVLAMGKGSAEHKCDKVIDIFDCLKKQGYKFGTYYELATLGVLALLDNDTAILCDEIINADEFLQKQKGFGIFGVGAKQRLMYAGMLTAFDCVSDAQIIQTAALNSVVSMMIAQQTAILYASIVASNSAVSSSAT